MKHRAFTLVEVVVAVLILAVLAAILFPVFNRGGPPSRRSQCQSNLKQIGLGFMQYAQDAGEKFPDVAASQGWPDKLQPYVKSWDIFKCPSVEFKRAESASDYFYNARAANLKLEKFDNTPASILAGDGLAAQTTDAALTALPASWITDSTSPAHRHLINKDSVGAVYLFTDGHTKWIKPEQITLDKPDLGKPTFLVKR